jgi:hypothetical protein
VLVQALHVAATLRIADFLADGSRTVAELAEASSSHPSSLYRLLRMLAGAGVFSEDGRAGSAHRKVVDVGGGQGGTLAAISQANRQLTGVLFDLPQVVTKVTLPESIANRSDIVGGDMLESLPVGGDIYILKRVLMDWSDEVAAKALGKCREAMAESGRVLVIEPIVAEGNEPGVSKFLDMTMLVMQGGGRVRTQDEHRALFEVAGLQLTRIIPTPTPLRVLEGTRGGGH